MQEHQVFAVNVELKRERSGPSAPAARFTFSAVNESVNQFEPQHVVNQVEVDPAPEIVRQELRDLSLKVSSLSRTRPGYTCSPVTASIDLLGPEHAL